MTDQPNQDAGGIPYWPETQPDTDAPPTCPVRPTGQEWREPCGRPMPCSAHSDAPQEGRPTTPQTEAGQRLWVDPRYGESATWEEWTDAILAIEREAAAGAQRNGTLPSVERLADALPQVLNFEFFGHPVGHPKWQEVAQLIVAELEGAGPASFHESNRLHAARLAATPPEASER
jgi:hypothetical protein